MNKNVAGSWCRFSEPDSCAKYGRHYTWYQTVGCTDSENCNPTADSEGRIQGICPEGWRVPSKADYDVLLQVITPNETFVPEGDPVIAIHRAKAGKILKSTTGWADNGNGTDNVSFHALPAGFRAHDTGAFSTLLTENHIWSSTKVDDTYAYDLYMRNTLDETVQYSIAKAFGFSVRCLKN